jgi:hypothetical protein
MKQTLLALLIISLAPSATADTQFTRVLLPITTETVPGANGSLWESELWVHASSDEGATILPLSLSDVGPLKHISLRLPIFEAPVGQPPGQIILVSSNALADVQFNLRVRDLSRQAETWGTEIPVVREDEFRVKPVALLPVPLGSGFRAMVRVYGLERTGGAVRVRVSTIEDDPSVPLRVVYEETWQLNPTSSRHDPPYAEIPLSVFVPGSDAVARVDVEPLTPGLAFWSFVSVTHNATQHVTVISPR